MKYFAVNNSISTSIDFNVTDFGLFYGYGAFETILIKNSQPMFFQEHWQRLKKAATFLKLSMPFKPAATLAILQQLITLNQASFAACNIYLTAGPKTEQVPQLYIMLRPISLQATPISLTVQQDKYPRSIMDAHKLTSRAKNLLARKGLGDGQDILFYNSQKKLLETTISNVFFIKKNIVITTKSRYILPGIMRKTVLQKAAALGFQVQERAVQLAELATFDELFLTGSLRGIIPICKVLGYTDLRSKDVTQKLSEYIN
jgi:branched-subunit amino acid aminotransferase/4-amino-4-deoxychorismate lyase